MSERQAKRLRRAERAYIRDNIKSLERGEPVRTAAHKATRAVAHVLPICTHSARGDLMRAVEQRGVVFVASRLITAGLVPS